MQDMVASRAATPSPQAAEKSDFAQMLKASVEQVNGTQHQATKLAQSFERGDQNVNLQDVMISMQKANISFQTMVQVRNRVVSAYQDIMNMPV
jgi:flagellar hook-basal body complex protein FliE